MLTIEQLSFQYPEAPYKTLDSIQFSLPEGKRLAIVGESGSGKTTLLKLLAGLLDPKEGSITLNQEKILGPAFNLVPGNEYIRMVMQDYGLKKNFTIRENIIYQLRFLWEKEQKVIIDNLAKALSIEPYLESLPHLLSGGQQQRAAIACALAANPAVLLMDEPFSNLDVLLSDKIKSYLQHHLSKQKNSLLFITHHTPDALALADYILVLRSGKVEQFGSVEEVYDQPVSPYVAALFDDMNFFRWSKLEEVKLKGASAITNELGKNFIAGIRTASIELVRKGKAKVKGKVIRTEFLGERRKIYVRLENKVQLKVYSEDLEVQVGNRVGLNFTMDDILLFPNHKTVGV